MKTKIALLLIAGGAVFSAHASYLIWRGERIAEPPARVEMDKAGYFVIIPRGERGAIVVEHYSYDNKMLRTIEGCDARGIYSTIIQNGWVSQLSHAAYLGKELTRAELSLKHGFKFVQDGA
jgi:tetrahydromethanopterin S-methyltransferase subunit A